MVALESTIITHGMEYPVNRDTALAVEEIVRKNGAIPATIAIINGVVKVGLDHADIEYLSKEGKANSRKCSRRYVACFSNNLGISPLYSLKMEMAQQLSLPLCT